MRGLMRWLWLVSLGVSLAGLDPASAQTTQAEVPLTIDPAMAKGAPTARVVIVEFSDYQ
jgi:hypothetical protein